MRCPLQPRCSWPDVVWHGVSRCETEARAGLRHDPTVRLLQTHDRLGSIPIDIVRDVGGSHEHIVRIRREAADAAALYVAMPKDYQSTLLATDSLAKTA